MTSESATDPTPTLIAGGDLAAAAQRSALIRGALDSGFMARFAESRDFDEVVAEAGMKPALARSLFAALRSAGVPAEDDNKKWTLGADYRPLFFAGTDALVNLHERVCLAGIFSIEGLLQIEARFRSLTSEGVRVLVEVFALLVPVGGRVAKSAIASRKREYFSP